MSLPLKITEMNTHIKNFRKFIAQFQTHDLSTINVIDNIVVDTINWNLFDSIEDCFYALYLASHQIDFLMKSNLQHCIIHGNTSAETQYLYLDECMEHAKKLFAAFEKSISDFNTSNK